MKTGNLLEKLIKPGLRYNNAGLKNPEKGPLFFIRISKSIL